MPYSHVPQPPAHTLFQTPEPDDIGGRKNYNLYPPIPSNLDSECLSCPCYDHLPVQKEVPIGGIPKQQYAAANYSNDDGNERRLMGVLLKSGDESCPRIDSVTPLEETSTQKVIVTTPRRLLKGAKACTCRKHGRLAPLARVLLESEDVITRRPLCQFTKKNCNAFCRLPNEKRMGLESGYDTAANLKRPVGIMIDPELVDDSSPGDKEHEPKFYPCKVKEKSFAHNRAGIAPICPKETSYQMDYIYRGKDVGRVQTYQFQTEKNICEFVTIDDQIVPTIHYGRQRTDLKPRVKKLNAEDGMPPIYFHVFDTYDRFLHNESDHRRISEYMACISKLGGEIFSCGLHAYAIKKARGVTLKKC